MRRHEGEKDEDEDEERERAIRKGGYGGGYLHREKKETETQDKEGRANGLVSTQHGTQRPAIGPRLAGAICGILGGGGLEKRKEERILKRRKKGLCCVRHGVGFELWVGRGSCSYLIYSQPRNINTI